MKIYTIALLPLFLMTATSTEAPTLTPAQVIELDQRITNEKIDKVMGAIKYNETKNDTKCLKRGRDGELGCYQILPSTWKHLTKKHLGQVKGFSVELEKQVVKMEITELVEIKKLEPIKIFKFWNSGNLNPCKKGINPNGTPYDSCAYVRDAMKVYKGL